MQPDKIVYRDRIVWWLDEHLHREDGPAIQYTDGSISFYLNDKMCLVYQYKLILTLKNYVSIKYGLDSFQRS